MVPASRICSGNIESGHSKTCNSKTFLHAIPLPQGRSPAGARKREVYRSLRFQNGAFIQPDFNVERMQAFCMEKLRDKVIPKVMAWLFTRGLPKLDRWRLTP
jgi:hypothetical protein